MDGAIVISFGPFWDTMLKIFIVLGIFAFAGITANYLEAEIRSWFGKKEDLMVEFEEGKKNITYDDVMQPFSTYNIKEDGTVVNNITGETVEPDSTGVVELDVVSKYPDAYLVQWGELENFSRMGRTDIVRSFDPYQTAIDLIEKYEKGNIRWRLAGNDTTAPDWHYIGFYTDAFSEDVYNHPLPKEKIDG